MLYFYHKTGKNVTKYRFLGAACVKIDTKFGFAVPLTCKITLHFKLTSLVFTIICKKNEQEKRRKSSALQVSPNGSPGRKSRRHKSFIFNGNSTHSITSTHSTRRLLRGCETPQGPFVAVDVDVGS